MTIRSAIIVAVALCAVAAPSFGAVISYSDLTTFQAATGATAEPAIPNSGNVGTSGTVGSLDVSTGPGATGLFFGTSGFAFSDWSTLIPGNDVAVSGTENVDFGINTGTPLSAIGFYMHEPSANLGLTADSCNATCVDSTFSITLFNGLVQVGTDSVNIADDTLVFYGIQSSLPFDRVEIRETSGGIDNEFFGDFYTAPVPEPGTWTLLALGVGVLLSRRRRR